MPVPHHSSFFTGRMPFLPPNQQRQSTEGKFAGPRANKLHLALDITIPAPHHSNFTGQMLFLVLSQQYAVLKQFAYFVL